MMPLVYALLPNKQATSYQFVLNQINKQWSCEPDYALMDFEPGLIKAMAETFPTATLIGCHFHLTQNLYKNMSSAMKKEFQENHQFTQFIRKIYALPYVHKDDILLAFNTIKSALPVKYHPPSFAQFRTEVTTYLDYVKTNYVGTTYESPKYPHHFWSLHERVKQEIPRTNNSVEGWNRRLNKLCEASHLPLYKIIEVIKDEQHNVRGNIEMRKAGQKNKDIKYNQKKLNARIIFLVNNYKNIELSEFLTGMAYNTSRMKSRRGGQGAKKKTVPPVNMEDVLTQPISTAAAPTTLSTGPQRGRKRKASNSGFDVQYSASQPRGK